MAYDVVLCRNTLILIMMILIILRLLTSALSQQVTSSHLWNIYAYLVAVTL